MFIQFIKLITSTRYTLYTKMSHCFTEANVFDIPDEVFVEILLYLNINERARLAQVLGRFDILVLEHNKFLRNLDFSEEGQLTTAADIEHYFGNEAASKFILTVKLCNVTCMDTGRLFNDFISKALNLVDINIHCIELQDLQQLASLLKPLVLVRRLSMDWPDKEDEFRDEILEVIGDPFGRLEYLSVCVKRGGCIDSFLRSSAVCQELKALCLQCYGNGLLNFVVKRVLANLESFEYHSDNAEYDFEGLIDLLPDKEEWIQVLQPSNLRAKYFHLVKGLEISVELGNVKLSGGLTSLWDDLMVLDCLKTDWLLQKVIRIINTDLPENFFSLASLPDEDEYEDGVLNMAACNVACALDIEDMKLLLKNPRHRIKYLHLDRGIRTESKSHLYSFACPSITELDLSDELRFFPAKVTDLQRKRHVTETNKFVPCFRMLVENTPLITDLTLDGKWSGMEVDETWDLGPLSLIQGWKNLRALILMHLPIRDGKFLIEIGKQCKALEQLQLLDLGPSDACRYTSELSVMLSHCLNLTDFTLGADNFGEVPKLFDSLVENPKLRRVRFTSRGQMNNTTNLIPAVEKLLQSCSWLTTFLCIINGTSQEDSDQLTSALQRLRTELNRPSLEFLVTWPSSSDEALYVLPRYKVAKV